MLAEAAASATKPNELDPSMHVRHYSHCKLHLRNVPHLSLAGERSLGSTSPAALSTPWKENPLEAEGNGCQSCQAAYLRQYRSAPEAPQLNKCRPRANKPAASALLVRTGGVQQLAKAGDSGPLRLQQTSSQGRRNPLSGHSGWCAPCPHALQPCMHFRHTPQCLPHLRGDACVYRRN
jgi:hypothetical protein